MTEFLQQNQLGSNVIFLTLQLSGLAELFGQRALWWAVCTCVRAPSWVPLEPAYRMNSWPSGQRPSILSLFLSSGPDKDNNNQHLLCTYSVTGTILYTSVSFMQWILRKFVRKTTYLGCLSGPHTALGHPVSPVLDFPFMQAESMRVTPVT